jgi:hypothetical protein
VKTVECTREQDVLDALVTEQWPERVSGELRSHVAACRMCADFVEAVRPILEDRDHAPYEARIPSSAVMWWRAQMRARQEATRVAARPITVAQVIASGAAIALTVALVAALSPWLRSALIGLGLGDAVPSELPTLHLPAIGWVLPALFVALWLVLAPLAIYFAVADD